MGTGELALVKWVQESWPQGFEHRTAGPTLCLGSLVELALVHRPSRAGVLTNSATTQAEIQGFKLAHSKIYPHL